MTRFLTSADVANLLGRRPPVDPTELRELIQALGDQVARLGGPQALSPRDIQEILWLFEQTRPGPAPRTPEREAPDTSPLHPSPRTAPPEDELDEDDEDDEEQEPQTQPANGPIELPDLNPASRSKSPALNARQRLAWRRALRHVALDRPSRDHLRVDVRATAQRSAAARAPLLVQVPTRRPDTVLLMLVDEAAQLAPWDATFETISELARQTGRLAGIHQLRLDTRQPHRATLYLGDRPTSLNDHLRPGRRHLVLLLSDGLGPAFTSGALGRLLQGLPARSRIAWLHPWNPETWHMTRYALLPFGPEGARGEGVRDALPLTVVPCTAEGLTALSGWVRGRGARGQPTVMLPAPAGELTPPPPRRAVDFSRRVAALTSSLPPEAVEALALAAAVPGGVDLALLQDLAERFGTFKARLPPEVMAEVVASGLFQRSMSGLRGSGELKLQFKPDAQMAALGPLPRSYAAQVQHALLETLSADDGRARARALGIPLDLIRAAVQGEPMDDPMVRLDGASSSASLLYQILDRARSPLAHAVRRALPPASVKEREPWSPRMHLALAQALAPLRKHLEKDLLERAKDPGVHASVHHAWESERAAKRTGQTFEVWRREFCGQVSAAWILSLVFVRVLEERGLLRQRRVGPGSQDSLRTFTSLAPYLNERDYLLTVFKELEGLPGTGSLFDARHNPACRLAPSALGARALLEAFQQPGSLPELAAADTRALGDLYQHLSEEARERYALLQTPDFIAAFILDQTLDPAIRTFGLKQVKLIDPTCGSGHFLIDAFKRLFKAWSDAEPTERPEQLALRAAAQVAGVDLNPFAVAIARFRLTLEFLALSGVDRLERLPALPFRLAVADSLLHGVMGEQGRLSAGLSAEAQRDWGDELFVLEDGEEARAILEDRYAAVVGNPPYIFESDPIKREVYRALYPLSSASKASLSAPFTERLFRLAVDDGYVGMINGNAFTKRDFGKPLVEKVLPQWDLTKIIDTSGAYIPGHGTPTLMLFGRKRAPVGDAVVSVLGKRGEREMPEDPANAPVWTEIREHHADIGFDGNFVSVETVTRKIASSHPWILSGGLGSTLKRRLDEACSKTLISVAKDVGAYAITRASDLFDMSGAVYQRSGVEAEVIRTHIAGNNVRDWIITSDTSVPVPYARRTWELQRLGEYPGLMRFLWPHRSWLAERFVSGGTTLSDVGQPYWAIPQLPVGKMKREKVITFAFVSTHNQFAIADGSNLFNRSSPIVSPDASISDDLLPTIVSYLNSSTVGFWCRQVMFVKGGDVVGDGARVSAAPWDRHLEYASNLLQQLPLPDLALTSKKLESLAEHIQSLILEYRDCSPERTIKVAFSTVSSAAHLLAMWENARRERETIRGRLVSIQEEIDWRVYSLFGLTDLIHEHDDDVLVPVRPEHRPFEVRLARDVETDLSAKLWFERHNRPIPTDVGGPLADKYAVRLRLIDNNPTLQLLETPEAKRRWSPPDEDAAWQAALVSALLGRVERLLEYEGSPLTARQLALELAKDREARALAEARWGESVDLVAELCKLVVDEGVPYLAAHRYTDSGLEKRRAWEQTWAKQAEQDQGKRPGKERLDPPPTYAPKDYKAHCWRLRGSLDVARERFILYPDAGPEGDSTPLVGWAGWDALGRAKALVKVYQDRKNLDAWTGDALKPLLAGLEEQLFWLELWHNAPDPAYGGARQGSFYREYVTHEARELDETLQSLHDWRPAAKVGRKGRVGPDQAALLTALKESQGADGATPDALAEALGVSKPTVTKLLKEAIEASAVVQLQKRPARYALTPPAAE